MSEWRPAPASRAHNQRRALTAAYDEALSAQDVLLMQTTAMKSARIPSADVELLDAIQH